MGFTVLMSVYNGEKPSHLDESLQSLVDQTLQANEVVLVEDGPLSDSLKKVIKKYRHLLPINIISLENNCGLAKALNKGIEICSYDLIARMDSDDIALPERFEIQYNYMRNHPEVAVSSSWIEEFDVDKSGSVIPLNIRKLPESHENILRFARRRSPISHPVVMYKKESVQDAGCYPLIYPEDVALWSKMLVNGSKFSNIPRVLLRMRTDHNFISRRGWSFYKGEVKVFLFQKKIGLISWHDLIYNIFGRMILRLGPRRLKIFLYKRMR